MRAQMPRLAIDYGSASTRAVLGWPDGRWTVLSFDGAAELSSAVHVDTRAELLVGAAAWRQAPARPDGFLLAPARAGTGSITIPAAGGAAGDIQVQVADLVAATLRTVAAEAARVAGGPVQDVRLVVPAESGPRRRTWLRQAAHQAGLGQPRLVEAPAAAAARLTAGTLLPEQAVLLIVDVGAGCEATVLRHSSRAGFEVLSTLPDPAAGGDQIDTQLTRALTGADLEQVPAGQRWPLLASLRTAKQALSEQVTVTMPMPPPAPPMIVHAELARQAAEPVLERAGAVAAEAVGNADLTVDQLHAVYAVGGTSATPGAAELIGRKLGRQPEIPAQPGMVAVLARAHTDPASATDTGPSTGRLVGAPPLRRLAGLALPGVASLLLYGHFVATASFHNGTPDAPRPFYYVLATWGELALAALFALITCLAGASLFAPLLRPSTPDRADTGAVEGQIAAGIGVAAAAGIAVAALYGVTAAVLFAQPITGALRWALLPILPTCACAAVLAVLARRRPTPPPGWDGFLAFPAGSVAAAAVGAVAVAVWWQGPIPAWLSGWAGTLGRAGGVLIGVAAACALVRHLIGRAVLGLLLGVVGLLLAGSGLDILAVLYALAAALWWAYRTWLLTHTVTRPAEPRHAHA